MTMQCDACGNLHMIHHAADADGNRLCASWPRCAYCNDAYSVEGYRPGKETALMTEMAVCWMCAFWENKARSYERNPGNTLIINFFTYGPDRSNTVPLGASDPRPTEQWRGMAGRRFDFERFDGSPPQSCYSLWSGGEIPARWRLRMPDNARFLNGAKTWSLDEVSGFDGSRG